jgi:membrane-anchored glycerophosphoryl diester phosphodiesterase (GDPDase)
MSLLEDSIAYTFNFWKENISKIFLYQLLFLLFHGLSAFVVIIGSIFLFLIQSPLGFIPFGILAGIGIILLLVFNYAQLAGYSLMVKRVREKKKVEIVEIFKECFKKSHEILAVGILQSLPMIILGFFIALVLFVWISSLKLWTLSSVSIPTTGAILPLFRPTGMAIFSAGIISFLPYLVLFTIFLGIILGYISLRIWLSLPVFMIERKGCIESIKESWKITQGKVWSSFFTTLIIGLIVGVIESIIEFPFNIAGVSFIGQIITYLTFTPLPLILPTAYYYSIKMEERKKQE